MAGNNFLSSLIGGNTAGLEDNFDATFGTAAPGSPAKPRRPRLSVLDILGGLGDAFAVAGGAEAQYQPNIDARAARERSLAEQQQQDQLFQQQLAQNQQKFQMNDEALAETGRSRIGDALAAVGNAEDPLGTWDSVVSATGLPPEKAAMVRAAIERNPKIASQLARAYGQVPPAAGTAPADIQLFELWKKENPQGTLEQFLRVRSDKPMTEYQRRQLGIRENQVRDAYNIARERNAILREREAREREAKGAKGAQTQQQRVEAAQSAKGVITEMRDAFNRLRDAGGINAKGQSYGQRAGAWAQENLPLAERLTNPDGFSARQDLDRLRTQGITSLLPILGGLQIGGKNIDAAKELDTWRKAIASASDYESAMRALDGFEKRIQTITAEGAPAQQGNGRRRPPPRNRAGNSGDGNSGGWKVIGVK